MSTEITQFEDKRVILMKSGLIHWVTKDTADKMAEHLANQSGHSFLRIKELDVTINTAEVEAVYNHQQYTDLCRVKSGEWQCSYGKWHLKKGECQCKQEWQREQERKRKAKEDEENNRPQTPEERERSREAVLKMAEMAALDGSSIFETRFLKGRREAKAIRLSTIEEWEKKNGRKPDLSRLLVEGQENTSNQKDHDIA